MQKSWSISLYFASKEPDSCHFLKWSSSIVLLGFLKVLQGFSLDIGLLLTYFQSSPCTWPFSEKCCLFVKLLHTDPWITQASQRQFLKRWTSVYTHDRQLSKEPVLNWSKLLHLQQMNSMWKPCPWGVGKKSSKDPTQDPRDASGHVVDHLLFTEAFSAQAWLSISLKRLSFAKWHTNWTKYQWKLNFQILLCINFDSPYNTTWKAANWQWLRFSVWQWSQMQQNYTCIEKHKLYNSIRHGLASPKFRWCWRLKVDIPKNDFQAC